MKLGHLSDVHVNVRHCALAKSPAHIIEDDQFTQGGRPPVGELVCNTFNALKALFDKIGASRKPDTALLLTGDLIDFNRNIDPNKVPDRNIGEQWKRFNVLNKLNSARERDLYPRGQDDMLVYSLVRYAYDELKLPVFMTTGNHEAYDVAYGVYPRVGLWGGTLGGMEILRATTRRTEAFWVDLIVSCDALDKQIDVIQAAANDKVQGTGAGVSAALEAASKKTHGVLTQLEAESAAVASRADATLDEYLRQVRASRPEVVARPAAPSPSGDGFVAEAWRIYYRALNGAQKGVADATNASIGALWGAYASSVDTMGHGAIGLGQTVTKLRLKLAGVADDVVTGALELGVRTGVIGAQAVLRDQAASAHLAVWAVRKQAQNSLQLIRFLLDDLEGRLAEHRKDVNAASKFEGSQANPGISADQNMTVLEATLAYGPTYGQTWTSLNFTTANFDWFGVLFTPLSDFCIALPSEPDASKAPRQVLVGLAWGETENFMNIEGALKVGADRHGMMTLPRASASIDEAQQAVLRQALALKGATNAPLVVASHFTIINYNDAALQQELSFVPSDGPRNTSMPGLAGTVVGAGLAAGLTPAGFNDANFGTCERNLKWYFEHCAGAPGKPTRVDWHLSGHSHRSGLYTIKQGRTAQGTGRVTISERRDPGMYKSKTIAQADSGTQFVVSSSGGPIGVQNLAGELNGMTLRPPAGSLVDCVERSIEQVKTQRTGRQNRTGALCNEVPRLAVALDYLYILRGDKAPPIEFEWAARTGVVSKTRSGTVELILSAEMKRLDCIGAVKVWVFELVGTGAKAIKTWHCLMPSLRTAKEVSTLSFSAKDLQTLADAMVTTFPSSAQGKADGIAGKAGGKQRTSSTTVQRVAQAFCEITLKQPTIQNYTEGPDKGKRMPDWSAYMRWEGDSWMFPLEIGTAQVDGRIGDFMRRREGEQGEVPDWKFLAENYKSKGYIKAEDAIKRD